MSDFLRYGVAPRSSPCCCPVCRCVPQVHQIDKGFDLPNIQPFIFGIRQNIRPCYIRYLAEYPTFLYSVSGGRSNCAEYPTFLFLGIRRDIKLCRISDLFIFGIQWDIKLCWISDLFIFGIRPNIRPFYIRYRAGYQIVPNIRSFYIRYPAGYQIVPNIRPFYIRYPAGYQIDYSALRYPRLGIWFPVSGRIYCQLPARPDIEFNIRL